MTFSQLGDKEVQDNRGSTTAYSGTATTTVANIPSVAGNGISGALITADGANLQVSYDGGTTYYNLPRNGTIIWNIKGLPTQLKIKTSSGSTDYQALVNFEES